MFENILSRITSPWGRRAVATIFMILMPLLIVLSMLVGTVEHLWVSVREYSIDLYNFVTDDIVRFVKDCTYVIRTGNNFA